MMLTPHFSEWELRYADAPGLVQANLRTLAALLEDARAAGGNLPMVVTSGYRAGDAKQHGKGEAADFWIIGEDAVDWSRKIIAAHRAGRFPDFGQLIVYPHTTRHVHLSLNRLGNGRKNEVRMETGRGVYPLWDGGAILPWGTPATGGAVESAPNNEGAASPVWLLVLVALFALALYFGV